MEPSEGLNDSFLTGVLKSPVVLLLLLLLLLSKAMDAPPDNRFVRRHSTVMMIRLDRSRYTAAAKMEWHKRHGAKRHGAYSSIIVLQRNIGHAVL